MRRVRMIISLYRYQFPVKYTNFIVVNYIKRGESFGSITYCNTCFCFIILLVKVLRIRARAIPKPSVTNMAI